MLTIEQRLDQLERRNRRLTSTLALMVVAICAVVTMAATGKKNGDFDVVTAKAIFVENDDEKFVVSIGANDGGDGLVNTYGSNGKELVTLIATTEGDGAVLTYGPNGKELVTLTATTEGRGLVNTYGPNGKELVTLAVTTDGNGMVLTYGPNGKELVVLGSNENGGFVSVSNKTGERIGQIYADEYGNGVVYAGNRKGKGRVLQPGP